MMTEVNEFHAFGIADVVDVDTLTTTEHVAVQVHGDRVLLNLSPQAALAVAKAIARDDHAWEHPEPWAKVVTRLTLAASAVDEPLTVPDGIAVSRDGEVLVPLLGTVA